MWKPIFFRDPNTGKLQGAMYDLVEDMGHRLDLKIDWTEEAGWSGLVEGLATGRFDLACVGLYKNAARAKRIDSSDALFYSPMLVAVRADETRLKHNGDLNDPKYKIAVLEGEAGSIAARQQFSKAGIDAIPQMSDYTQVYEDVKTKKADATLIEAATFAEYNAANLGILKLLESKPVNVFPVVFGLPADDAVFKAMINGALSEAINDGTVDRLLTKYEDHPNMFYRLAKPYEAPQ
jgi:ABC-type amino acid transport substrate-binding protein